MAVSWQPPPVRVLSYGGGLDSFAMLLDSIERGEPPDICTFCDVADPEHQDPGEWPGTYKHIREVVQPLCMLHGIEFVWLDTVSYPVRNARSLFAWLEARGQIPVTGPNRICTIIAKVERFEKWMDDRFPGLDVEVWVGFEAGEESRAAADPNVGTSRKPKPGQARRKNRFPLMEQNLCRCRAEALARRLAYPIPRKSACSYCPYGTRMDWQTFARELPEHFARTVALEANKPPTKKGKKLSIMGFRTLKNKAGEATGYVAPPLPEYIAKPYRPQKVPCKVCGAEERATKATACSYLEEGPENAEVPSTRFGLPYAAVAHAQYSTRALDVLRERAGQGDQEAAIAAARIEARHAERERPYAAVVVLPSGDGRTLAIHGAKRGKVGFPGGKLDPGETAEEAARRELQEETGLVADELVDLGTKHDGNHVTALFLATSWSGTPRSSHEGEVFWVTDEELAGTGSAYPAFNRWALDTAEAALAEEIEEAEDEA